MKSYLEILQEEAKQYGVVLLRAFQAASIPTSTYYRTVNGTTELRHETATRVMKAIAEIHTLQQASEHTTELRESSRRVDRRKAGSKT
jgi:predicted transcriptional regulator